uniref:Variant surface glycoprotein 1125.5630 n=1 Tax=Trypanosoma brucei TaxID=5691 RepID=A0A1J0RD26_9TRYP|nr:variant surface glycoprotein 1125.5630 [Trypanosoma brucei]
MNLSSEGENLWKQYGRAKALKKAGSNAGNKKIVIFTSAVVFLIALPEKANGAADQPISASHIRPVCDFKAALETVNGRVLDHIETATDNARKAFIQLVRTAVYVEKNFKGKSTTALEVPMDYYARSADAALQLNQGQELKSNLEAIRDSARKQGAIDEFLQIMAGALASATHSCLGTDETGSNPVKGNTGLVSLKANCGILKAGLTRTTATHAALTTTGFTSDKQGGAVAPTATPGTTGECAFTTWSGTFKGINPSAGQSLNQQFEMEAVFF